MRRASICAAAAFVLAAIVTFAAAAGPKPGPPFKAKPSAFNPGGAPVTIVAAWRAHTGLPDAGRADHGLILSISATVTYPPGASADATVTPVEGATLTSLSFDHKLGTQCTGGAPRWDVETTDGGVYGIACGSGVHTPIGTTGWEHISFSCADVQYLSGPPTCPFGKTLSFLQVLQDEGGSGTTLDNLEVNGAVMGKPGNST
jgi:hypothetical protein